MADLYVRADGSNTSPYETWAKAATSFATVAAAAAGGDRIFVDSAFSESVGATTYTFDSSAQLNPPRVWSVDSTGDPEPPTTGDYLKGAALTSSGSFTFTNSLVAAGLVIVSAGANIFAQANQHLAHFLDSDLSRSAGTDHILQQNAGTLVFTKCRFGAPHENAILYSGGVAGGTQLYISGGTHVPGSTACRGIFLNPGPVGYIRNFDASGFLASGATLFINSHGSGHNRLTISGMKLPASWTPFGAAIVSRKGLLEAFHIGSANSVATFHVEQVNSWSAVHNTTTKLDSAYSIQIDATANTDPGLGSHRVKIGEFQAGANPTITVQLVLDDNDIADITDADFWIEVEAPDSTTGALRTFTSTVDPDYGLSPAALAADSETWAGTSGFTGSADDRKVAVTLSGTQAGIVSVWACFAPGVAATVYVEPFITVT